MTQFEPHPPGALVGTRFFAKLPPASWAHAYRALVQDIRQSGRQHLHQLEVVATWRGCIDRVLLRGPYADVGLTVGHGSAAIWLDRRIDAAYLGHAGSSVFAADAQAWFVIARPRFLALLGDLRCTPQPTTTALAA